jgi:phospholipase/carboxylesterase
MIAMFFGFMRYSYILAHASAYSFFKWIKELIMSQALLECVELESKQPPQASVIWMHGLGADGNDFVPIVHELNLSACPPMRFVFPNSPMRAVTINNGYVMPAWYDILGADLVRREDEVGIRQSAAAVEALIEREISRGIASNKIVIAGFSQGCAMALFTALRYKKPLAGVMALSGYLPISDKTAAERSTENQATPIFMAHGTQDPVVIEKRALDSRDLLKVLGYTVQYHPYPMQHSVHPDEIEEIGRFLTRVLAPETK